MSVLKSNETTFENDIKNLQFNFTQLLKTEHYYNTSEITNHIKHINNALDNIKLDHEFQRGLKNSSKKFNSNEMKSDETNVKQLIIKGNELIQRLSTILHVNTIKTKEHNQIRETHTEACNSLIEYLQALDPYASNAYARLDNIAHHLGVTDRFVGYRNNLTRYGNQPINANTIWVDRKLPSSTTPDWKEWSRAFQHNSPAIPPAQSSSNNKHKLLATTTTQATELHRPITTKRSTSQSFSSNNNPMNRSAMDIKYPGQSETFERFIKPQGPSYSPSLAVAQPDYTSIGRPFSRLTPVSRMSEYSESYKFPDSSKLERYPWFRS